MAARGIVGRTILPFHRACVLSPPLLAGSFLVRLSPKAGGTQKQVPSEMVRVSYVNLGERGHCLVRLVRD
jgi:hypothetical protein